MQVQLTKTINRNHGLLKGKIGEVENKLVETFGIGKDFIQSKYFSVKISGKSYDILNVFLTKVQSSQS